MPTDDEFRDFATEQRAAVGVLRGVGDDLTKILGTQRALVWQRVFNSGMAVLGVILLGIAVSLTSTYLDHQDSDNQARTALAAENHQILLELQAVTGDAARANQSESLQALVTFLLRCNRANVEQIINPTTVVPSECQAPPGPNPAVPTP